MIKTVDSQLIVVLIAIAGFYAVPCQAEEYVVFGAGEHDLGYSGDSGLEGAEMTALEVDTDRGMLNPSKLMGGNRDDDDYYGGPGYGYGYGCGVPDYGYWRWQTHQTTKSRIRYPVETRFLASPHHPRSEL